MLTLKQNNIKAIQFYIHGKEGDMQLNRTTDYVVRIVYFLSNENRIFTSEEISEAIGCSRGYVISILRKLSKEGLVEVIRGVKGGFRLKKKTGRNQFV